MSIILFMLVIIALAIALLGAAGFLVYKLVTKEKPPKDYSNVQTPPSFRDAAEAIDTAGTYDSPPVSVRPPEREKSGERR